MGWQDAPVVDVPKWQSAPVVTEAAPTEPSMYDKIAGHPIARFGAGVASPLVAGAQAVAHMLPGDMGKGFTDTLNHYNAAKQRGMGGGFDWMGLLGSLAPSTGIANAVTKALPAATTMLGKVGVGAASGAAVGAAQPVSDDKNFLQDKALQTGAGAVIGGATPLIAKAGQAVVNAGSRLMEPLHEAGRDAMLNRYRLNDVLGGDRSARDKIVAQLNNAREIVPGSKPTAGEAMADIPEATGLASHQKTLAKAEGISPKFAARSAEQEAARVSAISDVAKTPSDLANAIKERAAGAKINYAAANAKSVESDAGLKELLQRPSMSKILSRAKDLAREQGKTFQIGEDIAEHVESSPILDRTGQAIKTVVPEQKSQYPVESLHYMKMAMDDLIKNPERFGIGASEARAIGGTQRKLIDWLGEKSPAYNGARQAFAADSIPINQMQVGQELKKALQTPTTKGERSTVFMNAVRDAPKMMKRATGSDRFDTLGDVLDPEQTKAVMDVGKDLSRKDAFRLLSMKTNLSGGNALSQEGVAHMPNLLSRPAMIVNAIMKKVGQDANTKINVKAAEQYLHPGQLAAALQDLPPSAKQQMVEAIMKRAGVPLSVGAARQF